MRPRAGFTALLVGLLVTSTSALVPPAAVCPKADAPLRPPHVSRPVSRASPLPRAESLRPRGGTTSNPDSAALSDLAGDFQRSGVALGRAVAARAAARAGELRRRASAGARDLRRDALALTRDDVVAAAAAAWRALPARDELAGRGRRAVDAARGGSADVWARAAVVLGAAAAAAREKSAVHWEAAEVVAAERSARAREVLAAAGAAAGAATRKLRALSTEKVEVARLAAADGLRRAEVARRACRHTGVAAAEGAARAGRSVAVRTWRGTVVPSAMRSWSVAKSVAGLAPGLAATALDGVDTLARQVVELGGDVTAIARHGWFNVALAVGQALRWLRTTFFLLSFALVAYFTAQFVVFFTTLASGCSSLYGFACVVAATSRAITTHVRAAAQAAPDAAPLEAGRDGPESKLADEHGGNSGDSTEWTTGGPGGEQLAPRRLPRVVRAPTRQRINVRYDGGSGASATAARPERRASRLARPRSGTVAPLGPRNHDDGVIVID